MRLVQIICCVQSHLQLSASAATAITPALPRLCGARRAVYNRNVVVDSLAVTCRCVCTLRGPESVAALSGHVDLFNSHLFLIIACLRQNASIDESNNNFIHVYSLALNLPMKHILFEYIPALLPQPLYQTLYSI